VCAPAIHFTLTKSVVATKVRLGDRHLLDAVGRGVQKRGLGNLLAHDVALEEVWEPDFGFVFEVDGGGDGEDLCSFY
jgi:hypothetical protein